MDQLVRRLDALTMVLKSCRGRSCVEPWRDLHPSGDVKSLPDSLEERFDEFYQTQPRVSFTDCKLGYLPEFEGPMNVTPFGEKDDVTNNDGWESQELRRHVSLGLGRGHWSIWT